MRALDEEFRQKGLVSVNEVGLDPGIDHLMAHDLVARYRASKAYDAKNVLSFTSYCGGVPKIANPFRYKFSWSPLGVLKARAVQFEPPLPQRKLDAIDRLGCGILNKVPCGQRFSPRMPACLHASTCVRTDGQMHPSVYHAPTHRLAFHATSW